MAAEDSAQHQPRRGLLRHPEQNRAEHSFPSLHIKWTLYFSYVQLQQGDGNAEQEGPSLEAGQTPNTRSHLTRKRKEGRKRTAPVREARSVSEGHSPRLQRVSDRKNIPVEH